jgi:tRNA pseudouridine55 synthase
MFGVLNIHKQPGLTSHDVVQKLRRLLGIRKIGHLGTLDPSAEGVLPVCVGNATRLIEYFPSGKRYRADVLLGVATTTLDLDGEITQTQPGGTHVNRSAIQAVLPQFVGEIQQQVPLHSAVHVGGKKLYKYAQQGITPVELPTKTVAIDAIDILDVRQDSVEGIDGEFTVCTLDVTCSSGTYMRSLARDIGAALGMAGCLAYLCRTEHGVFTLNNAVTLETVSQSDYPEAYLADPSQFMDIPVLMIEQEEPARLISQGMKIEPELIPNNARWQSNGLYLLHYRNQAFAIVRYENRRIRPLKVLQPVELASSV